jgi:hypothetical protein
MHTCGADLMELAINLRAVMAIPDDPTKMNFTN